MSICPGCGAPVSKDKDKCEYCGRDIEVESKQDEMQDQETLNESKTIITKTTTTTTKTVITNDVNLTINNIADDTNNFKSDINGYQEMNKANIDIVPKEKIIALVLCVFGGTFGLHYFYVGNVNKGLIYLFTMGIFGLGWAYDIIRILAGKFEGVPPKF